MGTDSGQRLGAPEPVGSPAQADPREILAFLATAPAPLRAWADARAAEVVGALPATPEAVPAPEPVDPADLALAELGEHDDEPRRTPKVHTPRDRESTYVVPRKKTSVVVPLLGIIAVAALVYGVFRLGLPAETANPEMTTAPPAAAADTTTRMADLEKMLAEKPDDVAINLELGVLKFNAGDITRAEQLWTKVTEVDPRNPQAWFNLGFVHLSESPPDAEGARADWEQVLAVAPDSDLAATVQSHLTALEAAEAAPSATPSEEG